MIDRGVEQCKEPGTTSPSLLDRVRGDDQAAWVRLVDLYGRLVYRWCLRAGLKGEDAADIGQEVFIAVARNIQAFHNDQQGDSFRGWLYTITRNKIRDRANTIAEVGEGGNGPGQLDQIPAESIPERDASSVWDDRRYLIHRAIELVRGEFEAKTWAAFWRTTVDGQSAEDVAAEVGISREAVYIAKSRVRRRLLAEFGTLIDL